MFSRTRLKAHFVGAPFAVPSSAQSIEEKFTATGFNTGNLLIGDAVHRLADVEATSWGTMVDIAELNNAVDLIVVPAANFLSPSVDLSWLLPIVSRTTVQVLMVGVGAQFPTTRLSEASLPEATVRVMRMISQRSYSISVRGQFTADVLAKFGIHNTRVTGCPTLFRSKKPTLSVKRPSADFYRPAFNGSSNVIKHAAEPETARRVELKLLQLAMETKAPYVLQNELPEMLIASDPTTARNGCKATLQRLGATFPLDDYEQYIKEHAKTFFDVEEWLAFIGNFEVVAGTRFHGSIAALSQGIPAAFIAHDSRTLELCETLRIPIVTAKDFLEDGIQGIVEKLDFSPMEKAFPALRENLATFFQENAVPHTLKRDMRSATRSAQPTLR